MASAHRPPTARSALPAIWTQVPRPSDSTATPPPQYERLTPANHTLLAGPATNNQGQPQNSARPPFPPRRPLRHQMQPQTASQPPRSSQPRAHAPTQNQNIPPSVSSALPLITGHLKAIIDSSLRVLTDRVQAELNNIQAIYSEAVAREQQEKEVFRSYCVRLKGERDLARDNLRRSMGRSYDDGLEPRRGPIPIEPVLVSVSRGVKRGRDETPISAVSTTAIAGPSAPSAYPRSDSMFSSGLETQTVHELSYPSPSASSPSSPRSRRPSSPGLVLPAAPRNSPVQQSDAPAANPSPTTTPPSLLLAPSSSRFSSLTPLASPKLLPIGRTLSGPGVTPVVAKRGTSSSSKRRRTSASPDSVRSQSSSLESAASPQVSDLELDSESDCGVASRASGGVVKEEDSTRTRASSAESDGSNGRSRSTLTHVDLMYVPSGTEKLVCRVCLFRHENTRTASKPLEFDRNATWQELAEHCEVEHPAACEKIGKMGPVAVMELRTKMISCAASALAAGASAVTNNTHTHTMR